MKNKRFTIAITLSIALVLTFTMLMSYAYWKVQKTQTGTNDVIGACLSIDLEEAGTNGFSLENAWPITDQEGLGTQGYTFRVINTCEEAVTYQIALDSLPLEDTDKEIDSKYIKVAIDNGLVRKYGLLEDAITDDIEYEIKESKVVFNGQIPGKRNNINGEVEHNIKLWISDDSLYTDAGKEFSSKVRVIAGQGLPHQEYAITPAECFSFDSETGTITGYDEENCTTDYLVVPQKINGVMVKSIDFYGDLTNALYCSDCSIEWNYVDLTQATGLETIENNAFLYFGFNNNINQELTFPDSVKTIGKDAFINYNGPKLTFGSNLDYIGKGAFMSYNGTELVIPNGVTIDSEAFYFYNGSKLTLGKDLKTIGSYAFHEYVGTGQELIIPDSTITIGEYAFTSFNGDKLTLGNGLKTISEYAFSSFNGNELTLGSNVETIGDRAFEKFEGNNQELIIPNSTITIGNRTFYSFNGTKLTIGSNVKTIGASAFRRYMGDVYVNMSLSEFNEVNVGSDNFPYYYMMHYLTE